MVDSLYSGYGEGAPDGNGPDQLKAQAEGNAYLKRDFPKLDYVTKATIMTPGNRKTAGTQLRKNRNCGTSNSSGRVPRDKRRLETA